MRRHLEGRQVRIWSGRHELWWAPEGKGYARSEDLAGVFDFEDAWRQTRYAGPENKIVYVLANVEPFKVEVESDGQTS
ncbi:hypothetical protein [Singulisphaera sp. PoT]|uniref:hypothetical protein n=1 Tax=Singulisphaera sp. PoT TaxID=3411797 RepID=UPI003BF5BAE2